MIHIPLMKPVTAVNVPTYEDDGGLQVACSSSSIDVDYPSIINNNDILFIQLVTYITTLTSAPTGWSIISTLEGSSRYSYLLYKRADGTESGSVTLSCNSTSYIKLGTMSRFSSCIETGTPYTSFTENNKLGSSLGNIPISSITSPDDSLCCSFAMLHNDPTVIGDGTYYSQMFAYAEGSCFPDGALCLFTYTPTSSTAPADSVTTNNTSRMSVITLALLPN